MTGFSPWLAAHTTWLMTVIGGLVTLALYSILYKENKVYRLVEHIYLGLATGYLVATNWNDVLLPKWWKPMVDEGQWWYIGILLVALLYYFIYSERMQWIARLGIGFFLGITSGRAFQEFTNDVWPQISKSFKPVIPHAANAAGKALNVPDAINNLIFMIIVLCVMSYFFFSFEQKHPVLRGTAKWGRWLMMFAFGATFGATVMARLAPLIDRVDYLLNDFGGVIIGPSYGPLIMVVILMGCAGLILFLIHRPHETGDEEV